MLKDDGYMRGVIWLRAQIFVGDKFDEDSDISFSYAQFSCLVVDTCNQADCTEMSVVMIGTL